MPLADSIRASQAAEPDETHLGATLEDPELAELTDEAFAASEAPSAPETPEPPPAEAPEPESEPEPPMSVADMWRAVEEADPDGLQEELEDDGWPEEQAAAQAEMLEKLQELAEDDPVAAADVLARLYAEQMHAQLTEEVREEFAPIQATHAQHEAAGAMEQLTAELGPEVVEANAQAVAAMIAADEGHYLDPATQQARVRDAFFSAEYARLAGLERGDDVKSAIDDAAEVMGRRDPFGWGAKSGRGAPAGSPAAGASPSSRPSSSPSPPHVGGETGYVGLRPPPRRNDVDPVIAEMDAVEALKPDMFGKRFAAGR